MINWFHNYQPEPIIFSLGPLALRWYGLLVVLGITAALLVSLRLAKKYQIAANDIFDLAFYLIIGGLLGARLYDVFLQLPYYLKNPGHILQIWQGGLAIHGAIIAGLIIIYFFTRRKKISFLKFTALIVPGLALGQAIGRWGNYFNQELFGAPTNLAWGIPISPLNRPPEYIAYQYFHPTFLYESLACLALFFLLTYLNHRLLKTEAIVDRENLTYAWLTAVYVLSYSLIRFLLEFIRLDETLVILGWRWPQIFSLIMIAITISALLILQYRHVWKKEKRD